MMDGAEIAEVWVAALVQELNPKGNDLRDPLVTMGQVSLLPQRRKHLISILAVIRPSDVTHTVY